MALDWFNIFAKFRKKSLSPEEREAMRNQLKAQLKSSVIEADTQRALAKDAITRACKKARAAIDRNDNIERNVAFNELRMHLALYRYMGALYGSLRMMESNLTLQGLTENFASFVHRMAEIRVPANTIDFNKLTAEALRGIQPVDFNGIETMTKNLIDGSMSATNSAAIPDQYLMDLVNGKVSLDDFESASPVTATSPRVDSQSMATGEVDAETKILQEILEGLK